MMDGWLAVKSRKGNESGVRFVPEADLRYQSEEEVQKYLGLLGNNYDL